MVFAPQFLGGTYEYPYEIDYFRTYRVVWQRFAKIGPGTSKNRWMESLPLSQATVTR